jgi:hypothetical protein
MKAFILYHPNAEFARRVETYAQDFLRQRGSDIELVSLDTPNGANIARVYDIVQYPALLVTTDDGSLLKNWQGERLPLMDEVAGYLHS